MIMVYINDYEWASAFLNFQSYFEASNNPLTSTFRECLVRPI